MIRYPETFVLMADVDSNTQAYTDQVIAVEDAIKTYGTDHIEGVRIRIPRPALSSSCDCIG